MILFEERNSVSVACAGLTGAISPASFGGGLPVSAGVSLVL